MRPEVAPLTRDEAIAQIKKSLRERSGKTWSVTGGRGTAWGWITITAPPSRRIEWGYLSPEDRLELSGLLGEEVGRQGVSVPAQQDYRQEYAERARGEVPTVRGVAQWD